MGDQAALPTDQAPTVVPWDLHDCTALVWFVPADAQAVASQLPDGFTPQPVVGLPALGGPPGADAYLGFEAFTCARGAGLGGLVEPMTYATVFTSVDPPDDLAVEGVDGQHYYKWHVLVPDAPRRAVLQDTGLPVAGGSVEVGQPSPGIWSATVELDELGTFTLEGAVGGKPAASDAEIPFAEFTAAEAAGATVTTMTSTMTRARGVRCMLLGGSGARHGSTEVPADKGFTWLPEPKSTPRASVRTVVSPLPGQGPGGTGHTGVRRAELGRPPETGRFQRDIGKPTRIKGHDICPATPA